MNSQICWLPPDLVSLVVNILIYRQVELSLFVLVPTGGVYYKCGSLYMLWFLFQFHILVRSFMVNCFYTDQAYQVHTRFVYMYISLSSLEQPSATQFWNSFSYYIIILAYSVISNVIYIRAVHPVCFCYLNTITPTLVIGTYYILAY